MYVTFLVTDLETLYLLHLYIIINFTCLFVTKHVTKIYILSLFYVNKMTLNTFVVLSSEKVNSDIFVQYKFHVN